MSNTNIHAMRRKVEQLLDEVRPAQKKGDDTFEDMTVFTEEERQQVEQLLEQITPKLDMQSKRPLVNLSDEELDDLDRYMTMYHERKTV